MKTVIMSKIGGTWQIARRPLLMGGIIAILAMFFMTTIGFAQEVEPALSTLFQDLVMAVGDFKKVGWQAGLAGILVVVISSMKNSVLKHYVWEKLGWGRAFVAPVLSLVIVGIGVHPFTWKTFLFAMTTGIGAIGLYELLNAFKTAPWVGPKYVAVIDAVGKFLGRKIEQKKAS